MTIQSSDTSKTLPATDPDDLTVVPGPSFRNGFPSRGNWQAFVSQIQEEPLNTFTQLWAEKALAADGVPLRKNFSFRELAKHGPFLVLYKLTEENRWLTTFCGTSIVEVLGEEITNRHLDEYGSEDTLDFWMENVRYLQEDAKPIIEFYNLKFVDKQYLRCSSVNLPLKSGTRDFPDMMFEIISFGPETFKTD